MVMNERIQQLADKLWEEKYWTNPNTDKLLPAQLNRFAELIVRECSQYIEDKFDFCGDEIIIAESVLKHFGVEE